MKKNHRNPDANVQAQMDDFLNTPIMPDEKTDKLYRLRVRLLEAGHIGSLMQKYVYTEEGKRMCLDFYLDELAAQDEKGSTGSWGKQFEVETRIEYAIVRNRPYCISDTKCRTAGLRDMTIRIEGGNYAVELKTGNGAVGYGADKMDALEDMQRFFKGNPIIVWDYTSTGKPLVMRAYDLLEELAQYKRGLQMWFSYNDNVSSTGKIANRAYQIQFSAQPGPKMDYLDELREKKGYNWKALLHFAEFTTNGDED